MTLTKVVVLFMALVFANARRNRGIASEDTWPRVDEAEQRKKIDACSEQCGASEVLNEKNQICVGQCLWGGKIPRRCCIKSAAAGAPNRKSASGPPESQETKLGVGTRKERDLKLSHDAEKSNRIDRSRLVPDEESEEPSAFGEIGSFRSRDAIPSGANSPSSVSSAKQQSPGVEPALPKSPPRLPESFQKLRGAPPSLSGGHHEPLTEARRRSDDLSPPAGPAKRPRLEVSELIRSVGPSAMAGSHESQHEERPTQSESADLPSQSQEVSQATQRHSEHAPPSSHETSPSSGVNDAISDQSSSPRILSTDTLINFAFRDDDGEGLNSALSSPAADTIADAAGSNAATATALPLSNSGDSSSAVDAAQTGATSVSLGHPTSDVPMKSSDDDISSFEGSFDNDEIEASPVVLAFGGADNDDPGNRDGKIAVGASSSSDNEPVSGMAASPHAAALASTDPSLANAQLPASSFSNDVSLDARSSNSLAGMHGSESHAPDEEGGEEEVDGQEKGILEVAPKTAEDDALVVAGKLDSESQTPGAVGTLEVAPERTEGAAPPVAEKHGSDSYTPDEEEGKEEGEENGTPEVAPETAEDDALVVARNHDSESQTPEGAGLLGVAPESTEAADPLVAGKHGSELQTPEDAGMPAEVAPKTTEVDGPVSIDALPGATSGLIRADKAEYITESVSTPNDFEDTSSVASPETTGSAASSVGNNEVQEHGDSDVQRVMSNSPVSVAGSIPSENDLVPADADSELRSSESSDQRDLDTVSEDFDGNDELAEIADSPSSVDVRDGSEQSIGDQPDASASALDSHADHFTAEIAQPDAAGTSSMARSTVGIPEPRVVPSRTSSDSDSVSDVNRLEVKKADDDAIRDEAHTLETSDTSLPAVESPALHNSATFGDDALTGAEGSKQFNEVGPSSDEVGDLLSVTAPESSVDVSGVHADTDAAETATVAVSPAIRTAQSSSGAGVENVAVGGTASSEEVDVDSMATNSIIPDARSGNLASSNLPGATHTSPTDAVNSAKESTQTQPDEDTDSGAQLTSEGVEQLRGELTALPLAELYDRFAYAWNSISDKIFQKRIREITMEWNIFCQRVPEVKQAQPPWVIKDAGVLATRRAMGWKGNFQSQRFLHRRDSRLKMRMAWPVYAKQRLSGKRVLVVGAGPSGLRHAIEARLNGAKVTVLEARERFTRLNVLYLWKSSIQDLLHLGVKDIYPAFGTLGDKETMPIAHLQHALLRIALAVGVEVIPGCRFNGFSPLSSSHWRASALCSLEKSTTEKVLEHFEFDAVYDGTGTSGYVRSQQVVGGHGDLVPSWAKFGSMSTSYAITANFKRYNNDVVPQFGVSKQFETQKFMQKVIRPLENIVYYRSPVAHYMVSTIPDKVLVQHGVVKNRKLKGAEFVSSSNVDREKLQQMVLQIARDWNIPHKDGFFEEGPDRNGGFKPSCSLFEFTQLMVAEKSISLMPAPPYVQPVSQESPRGGAKAKKCCCRPGLCTGNKVRKWLNGFAETKLELRHLLIDGQRGWCCKPHENGCATTADGYTTPMPPQFGYDSDCKEKPSKCSDIVEGAVPTEASYLRPVDAYDCKCPVGTRLWGEDERCRGKRKFASSSLAGLGCRCIGTQALLVGGDALQSPFWPEGTGANRALYGAVQHVWNLVSLAEASAKIDDPEEAVQKIAKKRYTALKDSDGRACNQCGYQTYMLGGYSGGGFLLCDPKLDGKECKPLEK